LDVVAWAERFIATPSVSRDGNAAIAECARELLAEAGIEARLLPHELHGVTHYLVIADVGPATDGGLVLLTHLDTVPGGDPAAWTKTGGDPFRPVREGDLLYGRGSADAKVDLVCKVAALAQLDPEALRRPVRVVGTFAEEIGLLGTRELVRGGHLEGFRSALVGEPSELMGITAHKGYAVFDARVPLRRIQGRGRVESLEHTGHAAHSSTPHLGVNAIEAAIDRLADAPLVIGIEGGGAVNVVPEACRVEILRPDAAGPETAGLDPQPLRAFLRAWRALLADLRLPVCADFDPDHSVGSLGRVELEGDCAMLHFDLRPVPGVDPLRAVEPLREVAEIEPVRANPPLATPLSAPLVAAVAGAQQSLGLGRRIGTKATCTEAGLISQAGLDVMVLGAGPSVGNVHKPNEHTRIPELFQARDLYKQVIERLCIKEGACTS
jgi:acetylornithine deacetylase/succinyl-diaminopimelate desuccinylase-like protein